MPRINCETTDKKNDTKLDQFSIYNGGTELYGCGGGQDIPSENTFNIVSDENTLIFNLTARSNNQENYTGFLISYTGKPNPV